MHGIAVGDEILRVNGDVPRDIIEWQMAADDDEIDLDVARGGLELSFTIEKAPGETLGVEVSSAVFDRVRTCDNHCEFCFIYQLPKGMRSSLYLKDDDYRLWFLYGNFTTLTRFTEADLERVVTERLSPLHVSIHSTDPVVRSQMLKNARGGMSLRWLRALLDHGITVRGQIVVCPGVNDGRGARRHASPASSTSTPSWPRSRSCRSASRKFNGEPAMRLHTIDEAHGRGRRRRTTGRTCSSRARTSDGVCRRRVLPDGRPAVPRRRALRRVRDARGRHRHGPHVRGASSTASATRPPACSAASSPRSTRRRIPRRTPALRTAVVPAVRHCGPAPHLSGRRPPPYGPLRSPRRSAPIGVLTGALGARIIDPLVDSLDRPTYVSSRSPTSSSGATPG